jgi:MarR family transcriptional regulator, organic hydroperoxide resistance regulator
VSTRDRRQFGELRAGYYGDAHRLTFRATPMIPDTLGPTLHALARAHRARLSALLTPHGLHAGQDLLLLAIWESPGMRQAALAGRLGVEPPTVTRMLQRLERGGMIERRADPHDGRVVLVFPTPRSRMLEGTVRRAWASLDERLIDALGDTDAVKLQKLARAAAIVLAERE